VNSISDTKIIGIDGDRPPRVRKEAYIDLFFRLSDKVPKAWSEDFNALGRHMKPSPKININSGECIETYVNNMDAIAQHLNDIKEIVVECNSKYQAKLDEEARELAASKASLQEGDGEQHRLNEIIAALDFEN
jgi:hypothetical protein